MIAEGAQLHRLAIEAPGEALRVAGNQTAVFGGFCRFTFDGDPAAVRGVVTRDAEGDDTEVVFLGVEDTVAVFTDVPGLAQYCRTAEEHELHKLEWWSELEEVEDDDVFTPTLDASYDLRKPSALGADLLRELADFCGLEGDTALLDEEVDKNTDKDDWNDLVAEVQSCLQLQD